MQTEIKELNPSVKELYINNRMLGQFVLEADGNYYFMFKNEKNGVWNPDTLRLIAYELDEINNPMQ
jgi:hypothetical protein